jgi:hypothetical protein
LLDTVSRLRLVAESRLGESGREAVEVSWAAAVDAIHRGDGRDAVGTLLRSLQHTATSLGGEALASEVSSDLASVISPR